MVFLGKHIEDAFDKIIKSVSKFLPLVCLKALRQPNQKFRPKILSSIFYSNLYLNLLRPSCENIFKIVCIVSDKTGNKSHNLTYWSSLQPIVVYFREIESIFPVPL